MSDIIIFQNEENNSKHNKIYCTHGGNLIVSGILVIVFFFDNSWMRGKVLERAQRTSFSHPISFFALFSLARVLRTQIRKDVWKQMKNTLDDFLCHFRIKIAHRRPKLCD